MLILGLAMYPLLAQAERKNGDTPEEDTVCEAADLDGAAWGLCNAYCEAMDCDSDDTRASDTACERVLVNWEEHANGMTIPCEQVECPCWSSGEDLDSVHDSNLPRSYGRVTFRSCFEDPNTLVLGLSDSVAGTSVRSFVSPIDASCVTETYPRGGAVIPVLGMNDLTDDEIQECSQIIQELCPLND
jgi:hypothetical protein